MNSTLDDEPILTWSQLAKRIGITGRQLTNWRNMPGAPKGKNIDEWLKWDAQRKAVEPRGRPSGKATETAQELRDMLIREQARKERAIASLRELELEMKEKSLMPESTIAETIAKICTPLRRLLDALPRAAAATANPGKPMLAERAIRNALDERIFGELEKIMKDLDITPPEKQ